MAVTVTHATVTAVPDDPAYDIGSDEWNAAHTVTNALDKTGDTMTGTLTSTLGTITADTPAFTATQTWNSAGVTFKAVKVLVTNTASSAGSSLASFEQSDGQGIAIVWGGGYVGLGHPGDTQATGRILSLGNFWFYSSSGGLTGLWNGLNNGSQWKVDSKGGFAWSQTQNDASDTTDTQLSRNAAGVAEVNNGTAGTLRDLKARNVITPGVTVASLAGAAQGARSFVTDATQTLTAGIGAVVTGGGANAVPVVYDGTNWRIG